MNRSFLNRTFFAAAFVLGLLSVLWVGAGFVGSSKLALLMTALIGAVFLLGAQEVRRYRQTSDGLAAALNQVPQPLASLHDWLASVPPALQNAVRQRIESERGALPGLALTPYLIGLLVMLGMLGTFLGMVVTFQGVVFTLEGSADLQAIRAALAAPIKGLGLAFGTSVVGVATSAMLGLMSAIARRERADLSRQLDTRVATVFRPFSLVQQRQSAFEALQQQAGALPAVATQLQALAEQVERRGQQVDEQLLARQDRFLESASQAYLGLAQSVQQTLGKSLDASTQAAAHNLSAVVREAMAGVAEASALQQERLHAAVNTQLQGLSERFGATASTVSDTWTSALQLHARTSEQQAQGLEQALQGFTSQFEQRSGALIAQVQDTLGRTQAEHSSAERERHLAWTQTLTAAGEGLQAQWRQLGEQTLAQQQSVSQTLAETALRWREELASLRSDETAHGQAAVQGLLELQSSLSQTLGETTRSWREELASLRNEEDQRSRAATQGLLELKASLSQTLSETTRSWREELASLRSEEDQRSQAAVQGLMALQTSLSQTLNESARSWREELATLRSEEAARGEAAVLRVAELQDRLSAQMAKQLAELGGAFEAPMARLIETAAEAPQAAADLIAQRRQEMGQLAERDQQALQERAELLQHIHALAQRVQEGTGEQAAAIESLVASAGAVLDQVGRQFADTVGVQAVRAEEVATQVNVSAIELASLGEAFGQGVELFSATNQKLMENLQRIESAVTQSMARSDEQLAYYVAQAREVIDLSISAQQGIVEDLRRLRQEAVAKTAAKAAA